MHCVWLSLTLPPAIAAVWSSPSLRDYRIWLMAAGVAMGVLGYQIAIDCFGMWREGASATQIRSRALFELITTSEYPLVASIVTCSAMGLAAFFMGRSVTQTGNPRSDSAELATEAGTVQPR